MSDQPARLVDDVLLGLALPQAVRAKSEKDQLVVALGALRGDVAKLAAELAHIAANTRQSAAEASRATVALEKVARLAEQAEKGTKK